MEEDYRGSKRTAPAGQWKTPNGNMWSSTPIDDQDQHNPFYTSSSSSSSAVVQDNEGHAVQVPTTILDTSSVHPSSHNLSIGFTGNGEISPDQSFYANVLNTHNSNDFLADLGGYILSPTSSFSTSSSSLVGPTTVSASILSTVNTHSSPVTLSSSSSQASNVPGLTIPVVSLPNNGPSGSMYLPSSSSSTSLSYPPKNIDYQDTFGSNTMYGNDNHNVSSLSANNPRSSSSMSSSYTTTLPEIHRLSIDPSPYNHGSLPYPYPNPQPPPQKNTATHVSISTDGNSSPSSTTTPSSSSSSVTTNKSLSTVHIAPSVTVPGLLNTIYPYMNTTNPLPHTIYVKSVPSTGSTSTSPSFSSSSVPQMTNLRCIGAIISRISIQDTDKITIKEERNLQGFKAVGVQLLSSSHNQQQQQQSTASSPKHGASRNSSSSNLVTLGSPTSSDTVPSMSISSNTTLRKSNSRVRLHGSIPGSPLARSSNSNSATTMVTDNNTNTSTNTINRASPLLLSINNNTNVNGVGSSSSNATSPKLHSSGNSSNNLANQGQQASSSSLSTSRSTTLKRKSSSNLVGGGYTTNTTSPLLTGGGSTLTASSSNENLNRLSHPSYTSSSSSITATNTATTTTTSSSSLLATDSRILPNMNKSIDPLHQLLVNGTKTIPVQLQLSTLPVAVENLEFGLGFDEEVDMHNHVTSPSGTTDTMVLTNDNGGNNNHISSSSSSSYSSLAQNQRTNSSKRLGLDGSSPILSSYNPSTGSPKFGSINTTVASSGSLTNMAGTNNSTRSPANNMVIGVTTNIAVLDPVLAVALAQQQQQNNTLNMQNGRLTTGFRRSRTDLARMINDTNNEGTSDGTITPRGEHGTPTMNGGSNEIRTSRSGRAIIKPGSNPNSNHNSPIITGHAGNNNTTNMMMEGFPRVPSNLNLTASAAASTTSSTMNNYSSTVTAASMVRTGSRTSLPSMISHINSHNSATTMNPAVPSTGTAQPFGIAPKGFSAGNITGGYGTGGIALNDFIFGGDDEDGNENGTTGDRRNRRLERNRESARVRRKKKRDRVELLEKEIAGLAVQLDRLHSHRWGLWREPACLPLTRVGPGSIAMERALYSSNHRNNTPIGRTGGPGSVVSSGTGTSENTNPSLSSNTTDPSGSSAHNTVNNNNNNNTLLRRSLGIIHSGEVSEQSSCSESPTHSIISNSTIQRMKTEGNTNGGGNGGNGGIQVRATLLPLDDNDENDETMDTEENIPPSTITTTDTGGGNGNNSTNNSGSHSATTVPSSVGDSSFVALSSLNSGLVPNTTTVIPPTAPTNSFGVAGTIPRGRNVRGALGMGLGLIPSSSSSVTGTNPSTLPNNFGPNSDMMSVSGLSTLSGGSGHDNTHTGSLTASTTTNANMITTSANLYAMESAPGSIRSSRNNRRSGRGRTGDSYQFDDLLLMGGNPAKALHPTAIAARTKALHDANEVRDAWLAEVVGNPSGIAAISRPAPLSADTVCNRAVDLVSNVHSTLSRLRRDAAEVSLLVGETKNVRLSHPEYFTGKQETLMGGLSSVSAVGNKHNNKGGNSSTNSSNVNPLALIVPSMDDAGSSTNGSANNTTGRMMLKLTDNDLTKDMFDVLKLSPEQAVALSNLNPDIERTGYRMTKLDDFVTALLASPPSTSSSTTTDNSTNSGNGIVPNGGTNSSSSSSSSSNGTAPTNVPSATTTTMMDTDSSPSLSSPPPPPPPPPPSIPTPSLNQYLYFKIVDMIRGPVVDLFNTDQIEGLLEWTDRNSDVIRKLVYPNYDPSDFDASGRLITNIHIARARSMATNATINGNNHSTHTIHEHSTIGTTNSSGRHSISSRAQKHLPKVSSSNSLSNLSTSGNSPGALLTPGMISVLRQPTPNTSNVTYNIHGINANNEDTNMMNTNNTPTMNGTVIRTSSNNNNPQNSNPLPSTTSTTMGGGRTHKHSPALVGNGTHHPTAATTGSTSSSTLPNNPSNINIVPHPNAPKSFLVIPNNTNGTNNATVTNVPFSNNNQQIPDNKGLFLGTPPNLSNFSPSAVAAAATAMMSQLSPQLQAQVHAQLAMLTAQNKLQYSLSNPSLNNTNTPTTTQPLSSSQSRTGSGTALNTMMMMMNPPTTSSTTGNKGITTTHSSTGSITSQLSSTNLTDSTSDPQHPSSNNVSIGMSLSPAYGAINSHMNSSNNPNHPPPAPLHLNPPLSLSNTSGITQSHPSPLLRLATNNTLHRSPSNLALGPAVTNSHNNATSNVTNGSTTNANGSPTVFGNTNGTVLSTLQQQQQQQQQRFRM